MTKHSYYFYDRCKWTGSPVHVSPTLNSSSCLSHTVLMSYTELYKPQQSQNYDTRPVPFAYKSAILELLFTRLMIAGLFHTK